MSTAKKPATGRDLTAFRSAHDKSYTIPRAIEAGLKALGDSWEYEGEFVRRCAVSLTDFARYREPYMEYSVTVGGKNPKRVWCGTKAFAAKCQEAANGNG